MTFQDSMILVNIRSDRTRRTLLAWRYLAVMYRCMPCLY